MLLRREITLDFNTILCTFCEKLMATLCKDFSVRLPVWIINIEMPKMKTMEFANNVAPHEAAHNESPHLDVYRLPFSI